MIVDFLAVFQICVTANKIALLISAKAYYHQSNQALGENLMPVFHTVMPKLTSAYKADISVLKKH